MTICYRSLTHVTLYHFNGFIVVVFVCQKLFVKAEKKLHDIYRSKFDCVTFLFVFNFWSHNFKIDICEIYLMEINKFYEMDDQRTSSKFDEDKRTILRCNIYNFRRLKRKRDTLKWNIYIYTYMRFANVVLCVFTIEIIQHMLYNISFSFVFGKITIHTHTHSFSNFCSPFIVFVHFLFCCCCCC